MKSALAWPAPARSVRDSGSPQAISHHRHNVSQTTHSLHSRHLSVQVRTSAILRKVIAQTSSVPETSSRTVRPNPQLTHCTQTPHSRNSANSPHLQRFPDALRTRPLEFSPDRAAQGSPGQRLGNRSGESGTLKGRPHGPRPQDRSPRRCVPISVALL